eukprot:3810143-Pleurochrysis_carterae.AAC.1
MARAASPTLFARWCTFTCLSPKYRKQMLHIPSSNVLSVHVQKGQETARKSERKPERERAEREGEREKGERRGEQVFWAILGRPYNASKNTFPIAASKDGTRVSGQRVDARGERPSPLLPRGVFWGLGTGNAGLSDGRAMGSGPVSGTERVGAREETHSRHSAKATHSPLYCWGEWRRDGPTFTSLSIHLRMYYLIDSG